MGNMFNSPFEIHRRYDLKGSTVGRQSTERQKRDRTRALKDLDFLNDSMTIPLLRTSYDEILHQLEIDAEFLADCNIIDYSVLLGVHEIVEEDKDDFTRAVHFQGPVHFVFCASRIRRGEV